MADSNTLFSTVENIGQAYAKKYNADELGVMQADVQYSGFGIKLNLVFLDVLSFCIWNINIYIYQ